MEYYHSKLIEDAEFEEVIDRVVKELKKKSLEF